MRNKVFAAWQHAFAFSSDILVAAAAWFLSFYLRFNFEVPAEFQHALSRTWFVAVAVQGLVFWFFGLYRGMWRYASLHDLRRICLSIIVATPFTALVMVMGSGLSRVPRSVWVLDPLLLILAMGGTRIAYRMYKEFRLYGWKGIQGEPVLVLGAGEAGAELGRELAYQRNWQFVGYLDDDERKQGRTLMGRRVLGKLDQVGEIAARYSVKRVIFAIPSADYEQRRRIFSLAQSQGIQLLTVPSLAELITGKVSLSDVKPVQPEDLLGRKPVVLDTRVMQDFLRGKTVMITGAGGSIGSELCRQIAAFQPRALIFFERSEPALYHLREEFEERFRRFPEESFRIHSLIGDVCHEKRVESVLKEFKPEVVFHAAAYKHVPLMEEESNCWEAIRNNAWGTRIVTQACTRNGVQKCVLVSTDKAVNPTNVMGASKRLAELVCQYEQAKSTGAFVVVRFGNVLGSVGSVIPKFQSQIAAGGPVTVTHPEMVRFFMSIPEACQLVMQAGAMGQRGEVLVLDMGQTMKIVDVARDLIRLSGKSEEEIKIEFTGLRPGEKLFEELVADGEEALPTQHPKLSLLKAKSVEESWMRECLNFISHEESLSDEDVKKRLKSLISEYEPFPIKAGSQWVQ